VWVYLEELGCLSRQVPKHYHNSHCLWIAYLTLARPIRELTILMRELVQANVALLDPEL
jgi:hypothetical protein